MEITTKSPEEKYQYGGTNDCVLVALNNLLGIPYGKVFEHFKELGRRKNSGVYTHDWTRFVKDYCDKFQIKYIIYAELKEIKDFNFDPDKKYIACVLGNKRKKRIPNTFDLRHASCVIRGKWVDNGAMLRYKYTHLDVVIEIED